MPVPADGDTPRVALVTGASRGLGRSIAAELAAAGHSMAIAARSAAGLLPEALDPILPFDSSRERLFARVRADSGARGIRPLLTFFSSLPTRFGHFARRSMPRHR